MVRVADLYLAKHIVFPPLAAQNNVIVFPFEYTRILPVLWHNDSSYNNQVPYLLELLYSFYASIHQRVWYVLTAIVDPSEVDVAINVVIQQYVSISTVYWFQVHSFKWTPGRPQNILVSSHSLKEIFSVFEARLCISKFYRQMDLNLIVCHECIMHSLHSYVFVSAFDSKWLSSNLWVDNDIWHTPPHWHIYRWCLCCVSSTKWQSSRIRWFRSVRSIIDYRGS